MSLTDKFRAKRRNEHIKAFYAFANTLAAAIIVSAAIIPAITRGGFGNLDLDSRGWVAIGLFVHAVGQFVIRRYMKPEE